MQRSLAVTGPAPPDLVWTRYVRPAQWTGWAPQIQSVDYPQTELAPGTAGVVRGPCALAVPFEVLDVEPENRCWTWRVHPPVVGRLTLVHRVEPAGAGARTTLEITGPALVVAAYQPLALLALRRLVRGQPIPGPPTPPVTL